MLGSVGGRNHLSHCYIDLIHISRSLTTMALLEYLDHLEPLEWILVCGSVAEQMYYLFGYISMVYSNLNFPVLQYANPNSTAAERCSHEIDLYVGPDCYAFVPRRWIVRSGSLNNWDHMVYVNNHCCCVFYWGC